MDRVPRFKPRQLKSLGAILGLLLGVGTATAARTQPPAELPGTTSSTKEPVTGSEFIGDWQGELKVSGTAIPIIIHLQSRGSGLTATMDSPSQAAYGISVDEVQTEGEQIRLFIRPIGGSFVGDLDRNADRLDGTWSQNGLEFPLVLARSADAAPKVRPQDPIGPLPYSVEEVEFPSAAPGVVLSGTLTRPNSPSGAPAIVLISGSGPQDRDQALMGHRPFWVLADHLTRRGISVLRFDDRGVGQSGGDFSSATTLDFADDALGAANYLRSTGPDRIGLLGHSEGGLVAPLAATRDTTIDFVVLLAAPGVTGRELLLTQAELLIRASGGGDREVGVNRERQLQIFDILRQEPFGEDQIKDLREVLRDALATVAPQATNDDLSRQVDNQLTALISPWFRLFLSYDPAPRLSELRCPVLVLNGKKDLQVSASQNLPAIDSALRAGGNTQFEIHEFDNLNHLFQTAATGTINEYATIEETIAPKVLDVITRWVLEQARAEENRGQVSD